MPRPDRTFRTSALILKRRDFGEADRLLTILTPEHGKIDVIAKGARKITSHKLGHVELFTRADMLVHTGRDLGVVSQAEVAAPYVGLRDDLLRGAYAGYCAELLDRFTQDGDDSTRQLFTLLDATFTRISENDDVRLPIRFYEMKLLDLVGFRPELSTCMVGYEAIRPVDQWFSYMEGGAICPEHGLQKTAYSIPIPMLTLKLMRHLQRSRWEEVQTVQITPTLHDDLERVLLGYVTYLLERRLQSVDFIRRLLRT